MPFNVYRTTAAASIMIAGLSSPTGQYILTRVADRCINNPLACPIPFKPLPSPTAEMTNISSASVAQNTRVT